MPCAIIFKMKKRLSDLFKLFTTFFFIGLFSFGGGYAMLSMIKEKVVTKHKWLDSYALSEIFTISEMSPGPIAINVATFIGGKVAGVPGAIVATLGASLPSFFIIIGISIFISTFKENKALLAFLSGMRAAVIVLIGRAVSMFVKNMKHNFFSFIMAGAAFVAMFILKTNAIYIIILGFCFSAIAMMSIKPTERRLY